jgi:PilZ domain
MTSDQWLNGRMERRLPIIVVVRLGHCAPGDAEGEEKTYTDNISSHGARIFSKHAWQPGDALRISPLNGYSACGKVVYCQKLPDERYGIGVNFQEQPVTWSSVQNYEGT